MYRLQITQFEENENYKDELKEWKQNQSYGYGNRETTYPQRLTEKRTLDVTITDEEYLAVKKEVLKTL